MMMMMIGGEEESYYRRNRKTRILMVQLITDDHLDDRLSLIHLEAGGEEEM